MGGKEKKLEIVEKPERAERESSREQGKAWNRGGGGRQARREERIRNLLSPEGRGGER